MFVDQCSYFTIHCLLRPVRGIKDSDSILRYLTHVGIDHTPRPRGPPRFAQPELEFDEWDQDFGQSSQVHQEE